MLLRFGVTCAIYGIDAFLFAFGYQKLAVMGLIL